MNTSIYLDWLIVLGVSTANRCLQNVSYALLLSNYMHSLFGNIHIIANNGVVGNVRVYNAPTASAAALPHNNNEIFNVRNSLWSLGFPVHVSHVTAAGYIDFRSGLPARRSRNLLVSVTNDIINCSRLLVNTWSVT